MRGTVILVGQASADSLAGVVDELASAAANLRPTGVELDAVLVLGHDERSLGATVVEQARSSDLDLTILESGEQTAWNIQRLAFEHVIAKSQPDLFVTLDAAGHHDARQIPGLVAAYREHGSGVTIGSRWMRGGAAPSTPWARGVLSRTASRLVAWTTGLRRVHDITTSLRVIGADAATLVSSDPASRSDYGFYCEFVAVAQAYGFTVDEVPITFQPRFTEVDRLTLKELLAFAGDLSRIRRRIRKVRSEMQFDQATWASRSGRMRGQSAEVGSDFGAVQELAELSDARHFTTWIVESLRPAIGDHTLEVGAGFGAISSAIAREWPARQVLAIEPGGNVYATLVDRCAGLPNVDVRQITSGQLAAEQADGDQSATFDTVLYVNVLEHIRDDAAELRTAYQLVKPGGSVGLFVPAMPSLYGSLDYKSGHYRRYTRPQLSDVLRDAGFVDCDVRYFDLLGVAPYWVMYRLLDVDNLGSVSSTGYDRVVVPVSRVLQKVMPSPPRGKNLVAIGRRPI